MQEIKKTKEETNQSSINKADESEGTTVLNR